MVSSSTHFYTTNFIDKAENAIQMKVHCKMKVHHIGKFFSKQSIEQNAFNIIKLHFLLTKCIKSMRNS